MTNPIILKNINMGGLSDSKWLGAENSMARIEGCDIHSTPGVIKVNQDLKEDFTPDDFITSFVVCSDENVYAFGSTNGKVWKRVPAGTWSHVGTIASGVLNAIEYNGYIYYARATHLGRITVANAATWTAAADTWNVFAEQDDEFHPMKVLNLILYIGDGRRIASVDENHVYSDSALYKGLTEPYRIKSLGQLGTALLIGTVVDSYVHDTEIYQWNTFSKTFSSYDPVPESGINSFLQTDNVVIVNAGSRGNLYFYNGQQLEEYKKIPGDYSQTAMAEVHPNAVGNKDGLPIFGLSNTTGKATYAGIYSLGSHNRNYPSVLTLENKLSFGHTNRGVEIGAIAMRGETMFVSWKKKAHLALPEELGIDVTDWNNKTIGILETRVINMGRLEINNVIRVIAAYVELPEDTEIKIYRSIDYGDYVEYDCDIDTIRKQVVADLSLPMSVMQIKIALLPEVNTAPVLEEIIIEFNE